MAGPFPLVSLLTILLLPGAAAAQSLGTLVSPGKLSKAHAKLEGLENCQKCHEPGKQVSPKKCLACHQPIADRIAAKKGVHREAAKDCVGCHVEHAGADAELRPIEKKGFDHMGETGFALDGKHFKIDCSACHKVRSFLTLKPDCTSCHADPHKGQLAATCGTCHPATVPFKETRKAFDHSKTAYALTGAHARVACEKCHAGGNYKRVRHAGCADCHKDPHAKPLGTCATCHVTDTFRRMPVAAAGANGAATGGPGAAPPKFDHARTGYALVGRHATVACASCHVQPATKVRLKSARCADCHQDVHMGVFKALDCAACHKETGFKGGTFDHAAKTRFPLDGKHAPLACASCHKGAVPAPGVALAKRTVDFRGARPECASCHADVHKGQLGSACATCHTADAFTVPKFKHPRAPEFFAGGHANVTCEKCHAADPKGASTKLASGKVVAARTYKGVSLDCASCHKDPHLGQVGKDCASCHGVESAKYAPSRFDHSRSKFPLSGKHAALACGKCHARETGAFPSGTGTAVRLTGVGTDCRSCHKDIHLGQLGGRCETCHSTETFAVRSYVHRNTSQEGFFADKHLTAECRACHKKTDAVFPAGPGTAVKYAGLSTDCARCHDDAHRGALGNDCASCHAVTKWRTPNRAFHKGTTFPLDGKHLSVPCASCHMGGVTKGTPTRCFDCHWIRRQDDKYRTRLGNECAECHQTTSWAQVRFDHAARTGFDLSAPHRTLACESCHKNQVFAGTPTNCYSCHRPDYDNARNPNHKGGGFPTDCASCHRPGDPTWHSAKFDHATVFPLAGLHATQACASCHKTAAYKGTPRDCVGCHQTDFQKSVSPSHPAAGFSTACESCHKFADTNWRQGKYPHTVWPLVGSHTAQTCGSCHKTAAYRGLPSQCMACHQTDYQRSQNPNHASAGFPTACESCHKISDANWHLGKFDHNASFPLAGTHATRACADCHRGDVFKGTARDCYTCHRTDFEKSSNPPHGPAGFSTACDSCHRFADPAWKGAKFDHAVFPLAGTHATEACATCHRNSVYKGTARDCFGCHNADFQNSKNPNHVTSGFPTACETCHKFSDATWQLGTFTNHSAVFPLAGAHLSTACANCHKNNNYTSTPKGPCSACHMTDFQNATSPVPHTGFPTACEQCHAFSDTTWQQKTPFKHNTYFTLAGAHVSTACANCHKNNNYLTVPTNPCSACHMQDYQNSKNPPHPASGFPTTCDTCHKYSDATWSLAVFSHTRFPLAGAHATTACANCHKNNNYTTVPTSPCSACHMTDFQNATSPVPHTGFPTACEQCHAFSDTTWQQKTPFKHNTYFTLAGAHVSTACANCHKNNNYLTVPTNPCSACHMQDYQNSKNPPHPASGFPTTCDTCHKYSDATWSLAVFSHTRFPLAGAHATTACANCHKNNNYTTVPTSPCSACHMTDFQNATSPVPHTGFPTACEQCHAFSDTTWQQKTPFKHNTYFTLAGAHVSTACANCHKNNNYLTVPTNPCSACHMQDYQNSKNPPHPASGFPTTCDTCHKYSDATWSLAVFSHTRFPLAGAHATTACANCHKNNNYTTVPTSPCSACHMTDFQNATSPVPHTGFPTACEQCHAFSDTTWQQKTPFRHNTYFTLAGAHVSTACANCHKNNNYLTVPTSPCSACHMQDYQNSKNPPHPASGFPTTCDTCHKYSDATWSLGVFSHTRFPLAGAHATTACANCHKNNNYTTVPTSPCSACHMTDFQNATSPVPHTGFPTACEQCHAFSDTTWQQKTPFKHNTYFTLAGAHVSTACANCHKNNNYLTVPTSPCSACHMQDYQNSKKPAPSSLRVSDDMRHLPQVLGRHLEPWGLLPHTLPAGGGPRSPPPAPTATRTTTTRPFRRALAPPAT